jgi:electron transfer flavoprotein alpha subunit
VHALESGACTFPQQVTAMSSNPSAIWVLAEASEGHVEPVTFELLGDAKRLASLKKAATEVILIAGPDHSARAIEELRPHQPSAIHLVEHAALAHYTTDGHLAAIESLLEDASPLVLFVAATANGRDLAPRLAARAGMGFFPHALTLRPSGADKLEVTRVTHGGGVHAQSAWLTNRPLVVTMKPGVADAAAPNGAAPQPAVIRHGLEIAEQTLRVRVLEHIPADPRVQDLREAERIVAGGRGVGGKDGFVAVEALADALHASVGASRVAVDLGWIPYERQVGQTGKTVAPRLYVAAGISGASHHLMGMRGSEKIVAINSDKSAPIFAAAHFGAVGDLHRILPALTERILADRKQTKS